jgi:hypothetical protein
MTNEIIRDFYTATCRRQVTEIQALDDEATQRSSTLSHKEFPRLRRTELPFASCAPTLTPRTSHIDAAEHGVLPIDVATRILDAMVVADDAGGRPRPSRPAAADGDPLEAYFLAVRVEGISPGAYHFHIGNRRLTRIWETDLRDAAGRLAASASFPPTALLVITGVTARAERTFGPQAYSVALLAAGHLAQNVLLEGAKSSTPCEAIFDFDHLIVAAILDLTEEELPLHVVALGASSPAEASQGVDENLASS